MASDHLAFLNGETKKIEAEATAQGMRILHRDLGSVASAPEHGHEHFGFKDGISQPSIRGRRPMAPYDFVSERTLSADKALDTLRATFAEPGGRLIWPGHFLFGYGRQKADEPQTYNARDQATGPAWAKNGSCRVSEAAAESQGVLAVCRGHGKATPKEIPQRLAWTRSTSEP